MMETKSFSLLIPLLATIFCLIVQGQKTGCPDKLCGPGSDGYHPHRSDCSKFCQCDNGKAVEKDCAPGTVFSDKVNVCVHKMSEQDECSRKRNGKGVGKKEDCPDKLCGPGSDGYHPHRSDCSKFCQCDNGKAVEKDCAPGTVFSDKVNVCVHKMSEQDECSRKRKGEGVGKKEDCPDKLCGPGSDGYHPHRSDCSKFCQCDNGKAVEKDCAPGTVFNDKVNVCVHKMSVLDECSRKRKG